MNLALLLPAGLAALVALLLPLLIHLARRSERRPTDFAALRWLQAQARPRRNLRFDEWPLLALRLLLVAALALLLARPVLHGAADATPWVVAVPGVDPASLRDVDAGGAEARRHWLAPGFPDAAQPPPAGPVPVASLLRELDASLPPGAALSVLVPAVLDDADAERPRLSRAVDWRIVPGSGQTNAATAAGAAPMPTLSVRHAEDRTASLRYLRAAVAAWRVDAEQDVQGGTEAAQASAAGPDAPGLEVGSLDVGGMQAPLPANARHVVWLAPGPVPAPLRAWIADGGIALLDVQAELPGLDDGSVRWRDRAGAPLVRGIALGRGQALRWTRPMLPAQMPELLDAGFPQHLQALFAAPPAPPGRVPARAYAPLAGAAPWPATPQDLSPWLALLIAALFLLERWYAASPRRRTAR